MIVIVTENPRELSTAVMEKLSARRWKLISQLRIIYPILQSPDKSLSINGFKLPNSDFTGEQDIIMLSMQVVTKSMSRLH